jgi:hypothetical protein
MVAFLQFSNSVPISALDADDNTGFMMHMDARMVLFS